MGREPEGGIVHISFRVRLSVTAPVIQTACGDAAKAGNPGFLAIFYMLRTVTAFEALAQRFLMCIHLALRFLGSGFFA